MWEGEGEGEKRRRRKSRRKNSGRGKGIGADGWEENVPRGINGKDREEKEMEREGKSLC